MTYATQDTYESILSMYTPLDIKDEMLAIDLEHRKAQLKIIDGGKK